MSLGGNLNASRSMGIEVGSKSPPPSMKYTSQKAIEYKKYLGSLVKESTHLTTPLSISEETKTVPQEVYGTSPVHFKVSSKASKLGAVKGHSCSINQQSQIESKKNLDTHECQKRMNLDERLGFGQVLLGISSGKFSIKFFIRWK